MKNKVIYFCLVLVFAVLVFVQVFYQNTSAKDRTIWEYMTISGNAGDNGFTNQLNSVGKEGWELVVIQQTQGEPTYYIFKRTKK